MSLKATLPLIGLVLGTAVFACSTETKTNTPGGTGAAAKCTSNEQCTGGKTCDTAQGVCVEAAAANGGEIGTGDGSPTSVTFTEIYTAKKKGTPELVDLSFSGTDGTQLWVIGYGDDSVHIGTGVTAEEAGSWKEYKDPARTHFMHKPPAFAWGSEGLWGICGDNDNSQNDPRQEPNYFMGPALFTSDLEIFTTQNMETQLGSHVDMLHNTSFCRGIAHVEANWFFAFNGELGSIEKYNFAKPHEPGGDDHSDGEIYRYAEGQVKGVEGVSSHMFYDATDTFLYIADTGNKRIGKMDTTVGTMGKALPRRNEVLKKSGVMDGATVEDVVPAGTLEQPSGLEVKNDLIYVSDTATSTFYVFDKTGKQIRKLETGLEPGSLSGFTFGPDGKIFFTNRKEGKVVRIDPITTPR
jgi:hypothetical protein